MTRLRPIAQMQLPAPATPMRRMQLAQMVLVPARTARMRRARRLGQLMSLTATLPMANLPQAISPRQLPRPQMQMMRMKTS